MKAAVFIGSERIKVMNLERPEIRPNEVLIEVKIAGICGSDLHSYVYEEGILRSLKQKVVTLVRPSRTILGHEFSGVVSDKGEEVKNVELGDRVTAWPILPCHQCEICKMGFEHLCKDQRYWQGAFSEFVKIPFANLVKVPSQLSYEEAAMVEPLACVVHAIELARIDSTLSVTIFGAGTIGLLLLQVAKNLGVNRILSVDVLEFRLEAAKRLGADRTINTLEVDDYQTNNSTGATDIVFECVGNVAPTLKQALDIVSPRGRIVIMGVFRYPQRIDVLKLQMKEPAVIGSLGSQMSDFQKALDLLKAGKVRVLPLITHTFPFSKVSEAFKTALKKEQTESIKVQVKF